MELRCLILAFNSHNSLAECYYKEKFDLIRVKVGKELSPHPGQFLIFYSALSPTGNEIVISQNARVEDPKKDDCIVIDADGKLQISSWIAFSSDPRHRTFERKLAFSDWYGFLDSAEIDVVMNTKYKKFMAFTSFIVVNDLGYKQNKTQLFKVSEIKRPMKKDFDELISKMREEEDKLLAPQPQRPARRVDNGTRIRPRSRSHDSRAPISVGTLLANLAITTPSPFETPAQLPSGLGKRPPPTVVPIASSSAGSTLPIVSPYRFNDNALIIRPTSNDHFVAWLTAKKQAALLSVSKVRMVRIGAMYECSYELKADDSLEIIKIEKQLERLPFEIEQADFIEAKIRVNLCSPNTKCALWSFHMGTPFLNSPDVGVVTIADSVDTPVGRNKTWQEALREYLGEKSAENMLCVCELVMQKVPKKLTNSQFVSDDFSSASQNFWSDPFLSEIQYMWQVKRICSTVQHHEFRENRLKCENLGENADEYGEDDEIARLKRENKNRVKFGNNIVHQNYDQQPCSSGSSFNRP